MRPSIEWKNAVVKLLSRKYRYTHKATIRWLSSGDPWSTETGCVAGFTDKYRDDLRIEKPVPPSLVRIWIPPQWADKQWPRMSNAYGVKVRLEGPDEEIVMVLAHELRHLDTMWSARNFSSERACEADAERYASRVLEWYKTQREKLPSIFPAQEKFRVQDKKAS